MPTHMARAYKQQSLKAKALYVHDFIIGLITVIISEPYKLIKRGNKKWLNYQELFILYCLMISFKGMAISSSNIMTYLLTTRSLQPTTILKSF